jgi:outer membrane protein assembly factor BamD (BamD/ComL family)
MQPISFIVYWINRLIFLALLSVIYFNIQVYSQADIKTKISQGLESLYNFNFKSAENSFNNIISRYPENPAGYYYKSISHLWFYLDNKNQNDFESFFAFTDIAIGKAGMILKNDSDNVFTLYILGSVYASRTFAFTRDENFFEAIISARKFHLCFNELFETDSLYYDAYMNKGLFNFAISQAPQTWSWALNLAGMTGDKRAGLEYLETASAKGKLSKVDAQFYLSQIYSEFLMMYQPAKKILVNLNHRYPKNLLFRFALANLQVKTFDFRNAAENYKAVFASKDTNFIQLKNYAGLALGDILYTGGNYAGARKYLKNFFENSSDSHFKGITALRLGLSCLFEGDSIAALLYFDKTSEGNKDLDDDVYARIKGEQYLKKLPGSDELKLILIRNMINAGRFNAALDSLEKFIGFPVSDTLRAEAILYFSDAWFHLGKYKKSLEYAVAVFNFDNCETWVKPFACYRAAKASRELGNMIDAKLFIEYANNFNNYFFENKLKDRLRFLSFLLTEK